MLRVRNVVAKIFFDIIVMKLHVVLSVVVQPIGPTQPLQLTNRVERNNNHRSLPRGGPKDTEVIRNILSYIPRKD